MYKFDAKFFSVILAMTMLCGCTEISEETPEVVTETTTVEYPYPVTVGSLIFNETPESVGSLSPALTEIICELGFSEKIIGRSSYCNFPENITDKVDLGSSANPDVDTIIDTAPQLLVSMSPIAKKDIIAIEAVGTRVWIISQPESIDELYECYHDIAAAFGGKLDCAAAAEKALEPLKTALNDAEEIMESFVYIMSPELAVASNLTFAGNFFSCFGENAAGSTEDISLTAENLLELDPEWLILPENLDISDLPEEIQELSAVADGKIITLNNDVLERLERPTSRLYDVVYDVLGQIEAVKADDEVNTGESE